MNNVEFLLSKVTNDVANNVSDYCNSKITIAEMDVALKNAIKPLKAKIETLIGLRNDAITNGMSLDDAIRKYPTSEYDTKIRALQNQFKEDVKPYREQIKEALKLIPESLYDSYQKWISGNDRIMWDCLDEFLENCGVIVTNKNGRKTRDFAKVFCRNLGTKISNSKTLLETGRFTSLVSKKTFNEHCMAVFADLLVEAKRI